MKKSIIIFLLFIIVLISSCNPQDKPQTKDNPAIVLDKDKIISKEICSERNLDNKIIQLESKFCGHCATSKPLLEKLVKENNLKITFLDISNGQDREIIDLYNLEVMFTPTLIIDCKVFIGGQSEEVYKSLIEDFLENE